ncbi:hypothetical protein DY000_02013796 [Brassica cretica]|uniref:Uncharacterized protein n=1 Tax=Brassica cretica TaxID=69181 RepID=A0ABQ7DBV6_BRACR|nr:hypothetical protein DY000_02013796 [Brassica cretica]
MDNPFSPSCDFNQCVLVWLRAEGLASKSLESPKFFSLRFYRRVFSLKFISTKFILKLEEIGNQKRDPGCRELPERKAAQTLKQRDNLQLPRDPIIKTITEKCIHVTASPFEIASPTARRGVYKTGDAVVRNRVLEISVTNPPTLGPYTPI